MCNKFFLLNKQITNLRQKLINYVLINKITPKNTILLYCKKGIRAEIAKKILNSIGYKKVKNLGGLNTGKIKEYIKSYKVTLCKC